MSRPFLRIILTAVAGVILAAVSRPVWADGPQTFANCRLGVGGAYSPYVGDYNIGQLNMGRYLDWSVRSDPATQIGLPAGVEFIQTVRVHQLKTCGAPCIGSYLEPPQYSVSPSLATITGMAASRPGMLWRIGNEIERPDWNGGGQDEITPELYATVYHHIQAAIKSADPTARLAVGSVILGSPLRLAYLERVWTAYQNQFGYAMGQDIDVWIMHTFLLREVENSWGAEVPVGFSNTDSDPTNNFDPHDGFLYGANWNTIFEKHHDLNEFEANIVNFRTWMADHGEQNKPLINTEYGILYTAAYGITDQDVKNYLTGSFDYLFTATDPTIGYPRDGYRLVQGWVWYSLEDDQWNGNLFNPNTKVLSQFGQTWLNYVTNPAKPPASTPQPNLLVTDVQATVNPPQVIPGQSAAITLTAEIANNGNTAAPGPIVVTFWDGDPANPDSTQIGEMQVSNGLPGCGRYTTAATGWQREAGEYPWFVQIEPLTGETSTGDNVAGSTVTVTRDDRPALNLSLNKTVNETNPLVGSAITYTLTLTNNGPKNATGVLVDDSLPAGVLWQGDWASQGSYAESSGVWLVGTVTAGTRAVLTVTALVESGFGGAAITNTAIVTADQLETYPDDNHASVRVVPVANADLQIDKGINQVTPFSDSILTYTLTAANHGPTTAADVVVQDTMPAGVAFKTFSASQGQFNADTGLWSVGAIPPGVTITAAIVAQAQPGFGGITLTNRAEIAATGTDPITQNNTAQVDVWPVALADVSLLAASGVEANRISLDLTVYNDGPDQASGVVVEQFTLPPGSTFSEAQTSQGVFSATMGIWTVGQIPAGLTATLTVTATVESGQSFSINHIQVTAAETDPEPANNTTAVSADVPLLLYFPLIFKTSSQNGK